MKNETTFQKKLSEHEILVFTITDYSAKLGVSIFFKKCLF